jgi:N6-adenosine-specific RNA methylase IME4
VKKKAKKPSKPCPASICGGTFKCALELDHSGDHSTGKGKQYATWSTIEDGRIKVISYSGGKKMSEWFEDAPAAPAPAKNEQLAKAGYCGARFESDAMMDGFLDVCTLTAGHGGVHENTSTGFREVVDEGPEDEDPTADEVRSDEERDLARQHREAREAHARELEADEEDDQDELFNAANADRWWWGYRGQSFKGQPGHIHVMKYTGDMRPVLDAGAHPLIGSTVVGPFLLAEYENVEQAERRVREALGDVPKPADERSLTDACSKCGREIGEHDGKKCPKPAKARAPEVSIGAFPITPVTPDDDRVSGGPRILGYRRHPAAALFPLLEGEAFERFADRIQQNGLRDAIELVKVGGEEFILDGSNRGLACAARGVKPRFKHYEGPKDLESLITYSLDKNGDGRRHLDPSVRAMIAAEAAKLPQGNPGDRETGRSAGLMTQAEAGKRLGVSERLVRRAVVVRDKGTPKVKEAVMKGKLAVEAAEQVTKLSKAKQDEIADQALAKKGQIKSGRVKALVQQEEKRAVVRKINEQKVPPTPIGPFRVIYADFPWPYDNSDQHDGSRGHIPYPPMPVSEGIAMRGEIDKLAHPDGCLLGFWTTNAFVPDAVRMVEAWGFTWRTMYTWDKERDGVGTWGRGRTEHLIIASRGDVTHTLNEVSTLLRAPRREHSRKPDEAAELFRLHCPGPHLEMFAREPRSGWSVWGAETQKFATEAA